MTPHLLAAVWAAILLSASGGEPSHGPPLLAPLLAADTMRAHFIEVGQAAAALLELPSGAVTIDAGGASDEDSATPSCSSSDARPNRTLNWIGITLNLTSIQLYQVAPVRSSLRR